MKNFIKYAAISGLVTLSIPSVAAASPTASADVTLSANVDNTCYINSLTPTLTPSGVNGTSAGAGTSDAVTISYTNNLSNVTTAVALQTVVKYSLNAYCNYASHAVAIKSLQGGLVTANNATTVGNFDHRINYTADFDWGTVHPTITTTGNLNNGNAAPVVDNEVGPVPTNSNSTLTITTTAGTNPLVGGSYGDDLRISFGAAL